MKKNKKIRRGDQVKVITGNYKGEVGEVLRVDGERVIVQGINVKKKHVKPTEQNPQGGTISLERPIHISNLRMCPKEAAVSLQTKRNADGEKVFVYQSDGKEVEYRSIKKSNM